MRIGELGRVVQIARLVARDLEHHDRRVVRPVVGEHRDPEVAGDAHARPARAARYPTRSVVVDLPLVPVTITTRCGPRRVPTHRSTGVVILPAASAAGGGLAGTREPGRAHEDVGVAVADLEGHDGEPVVGAGVESVVDHHELGGRRGHDGGQGRARRRCRARAARPVGRAARQGASVGLPVRSVPAAQGGHAGPVLGGSASTDATWRYSAVSVPCAAAAPVPREPGRRRPGGPATAASPRPSNRAAADSSRSPTQSKGLASDHRALTSSTSPGSSNIERPKCAAHGRRARATAPA